MRRHEYLTYIWLTLVSIYEPSLSIKNEKTLTKKKEPSICLESLGTGRTNCTCYVSLSFSTLLSPPHNCYNIFSSPPDPTPLPKKKKNPHILLYHHNCFFPSNLEILAATLDLNNIKDQNYHAPFSTLMQRPCHDFPCFVSP